MSIERIFYCDGPDCRRHVQTQCERLPGFLVVSDDEEPDRHFCGWDCVMRYAAQIEPEEVIGVD